MIGKNYGQFAVWPHVMAERTRRHLGAIPPVFFEVTYTGRSLTSCQDSWQNGRGVSLALSNGRFRRFGCRLRRPQLDLTTRARYSPFYWATREQLHSPDPKARKSVKRVRTLLEASIPSFMDPGNAESQRTAVGP